jgi:hypothetical protein
MGRVGNARRQQLRQGFAQSNQFKRNSGQFETYIIAKCYTFDLHQDLVKEVLKSNYKQLKYGCLKFLI